MTVLFRVTYICGKNCKEKSENKKHKIQNCGSLGGWGMYNQGDTQMAKTTLNSLLKAAPPPPVPTSRVIFVFLSYHVNS